MLEFIAKFSKFPPKVDVAFLHSKGGKLFQKSCNGTTSTSSTSSSSAANGAPVNVEGCRNTILQHLMPLRDRLL
jgi:hypothetical protein